MKSSPTFSVILPTIGRLTYLKEAIDSVLWQTFDDFELIVSDNSGQDSVKKIVDVYAPDRRVRYVKPDAPLNMPDHWEFASLRAEGEFAFILQDRVVMLPGALELANRELLRCDERPDVIYWPHLSSYDHRTGRVSSIDAYRGTAEVKNPKEIIGSFARFEIPRTHVPHSSNGLYHRDLAKMIRSRHGRLFSPLAPDDASGFLQLAYAKKLLFIDHPLWIGRLTDFSNSNGARAQSTGTLAYASSVGRADFLHHVPVPIDTVLNCVIYDLLAVQKIVDPRLSDMRLDVGKYSLAIYREILDKDMAGSSLDLTLMHKQWKEFVATLPSALQLKLADEAAALDDAHHSPIGRFKRIARRIGVQSYLSLLKAWLRPRGWSRAKYKTILEAAFELDARKSFAPARQTV